MTSSIRTFLLVNLLLSITLILSLAIVADIFIERADLRKHLDNQLKLVAVTIEKFVSPEDIAQSKLFVSESLHKRKGKMSPEATRVLQYQVWDTPEGKLVLKPAEFRNKFLAYSKKGFSDKLINNELWRVYTDYDKEKKIKLILAERYNFRQGVEARIIRDSVFIFLATYPVLGLLIWIIVGRGFVSLNRLARALSYREPARLEPFYFHNVPVEIQPLINELNHLFERLKSAFEREKRFAADAAHELRTPLAVIKAQSQIALTAQDEVVRHDALKKLIAGVDRSSHVVDQLLTLSRMESQDLHTSFSTVDLVRQAREMIALMVPDALKKNIDIELQTQLPEALVPGIPTAIDILIRNLVDNAIRYTQEGGVVQVVIESAGHEMALKVIDNGPGIPPELRDRVFERFFRVIGTSAKGTGLGLGIVQQIIKVHQARIVLDTPSSGKGLEVVIYFPISGFCALGAVA